MTDTAPETKSEKPYNLEPNVEAALSYAIAPLTGFAVYALEKNNSFVRFHAMQSIVFGIAVFIGWVVLTFLASITLGILSLLMPFFGLAVFGVWLFLMWKAYNNQEYELPMLGGIARKQLTK